jgi:TPR repeat protein
MNVIVKILLRPRLRLLCGLLFLGAYLSLQSQTRPAARPDEAAQSQHYLVQKDYDEVRRNAGKLKAEDLPALEQKAHSSDIPSLLLLGMVHQMGCGVVKDNIKDALVWYRKAAEQGNSIAENQIGVYYDAGSGHNKAEGLRWYRKAAGHENDAVAEHNLGEVLFESSKKNDRAEGLDWLRKSFEHGADNSLEDVLAYYMNGEALPGKGRSENQRAGLDLLETWARQENVKAQKILAYTYLEGNFGVKKDPAQAYQWMAKAAEKSAEAQGFLGWFHQRGIGVPASNEEAVRWFRKSADQGNAVGQSNLGYMYEEGLGVLKDLAEAAKWFTAAADQNDGMSQLHLGEMYESGRGVPKDQITALMWFMLAKQAGSQDFMKELHPNFKSGGFSFFRHPPAKDYAEAMRRADAWHYEHLCR